MNELDQARERISAIDTEMARLFTERMAQAEIIAQYKKKNGLQVHDGATESDIIEKKRLLVDDPAMQDYYIPFIKKVMDLSKDYQNRLLQGMKIAYNGVPGAFAYIAARKAYPTAELIPYPDFESAYRACEDGLVDAVILPVENSFAGDIDNVMDLAFSGNLYINMMTDLPVTQNLLGLKGADKHTIKTVASHPNALAQCSRYIHENGFGQQQTANTAVAAKFVAESRDMTLGAIASEETARLYGLDIIERHINSTENNTTRFATFSRTRNDSIRKGRKYEHFVLMFTVPNEAGSLAKTLNIIGSHGFNMSNLHSRPMKGLLWNYYFYIELEGNIKSEDGDDLLRQLGTVCDKLKLLGTY